MSKAKTPQEGSVPKDEKHGCYAVQIGHDHFRCRACKFEGSLREAIAHAVQNQWTVYA